MYRCNLYVTLKVFIRSVSWYLVFSGGRYKETSQSMKYPRRAVGLQAGEVEAYGSTEKCSTGLLCSCRGM
jgi:hypothetical protein